MYVGFREVLLSPIAYEPLPPISQLQTIPLCGTEVLLKYFLAPCGVSKQTPLLSKSAIGLQKTVVVSDNVSTQPYVSVKINVIS